MRSSVKKRYAKSTKKKNVKKKDLTPAEMTKQIRKFLSEEIECVNSHKKGCNCTHCHNYRIGMSNRQGHKAYCSCVVCKIYRQRIRMISKRPINRFKR